MQQHVGNTRDLPVILQACRGYRGAAACAGLASLGAALISVEGVVRNYHSRTFAGSRPRWPISPAHAAR